MPHGTTIFEPSYFKRANLQNVFKVQDSCGPEIGQINDHFSTATPLPRGLVDGSALALWRLGRPALPLAPGNQVALQRL